VTALWTAREAAGATGAKLAHGEAWIAEGVSIDTRAVQPGDLFVALKGPRFDGHDFVVSALSNGAAAAMIDRQIPGADPAFLLSVPDTQAGLEALARAARARSKAGIVAVTGSVGKTGTKEALAKALGSLGPTHASSGNLNNHIGLPLSLARLPAGVRFGVFEIGMNHAGEIAPLSTLLRPHVAIITNVEAVHIAHFPNIEAIADAKAEIFEGMTPDGTVVLNRDNPHFTRLANRAKDRNIRRIWSFGAAQDAEACLLSVSLKPDGSSVQSMILGHRVNFTLPLPGRHHALNALAVLLAVAALDGDVAAAAEALAKLSPVQGRGSSVDITMEKGSFRLIDESYNASPVSVRAALSVLALTQPGAGGRRLVVLGDMLELGDSAIAEHAGLAGALVAANADTVFTVGPLMRHLTDALPVSLRGGHAEQSAALAPLVAATVRPNDVVLVKGSAGSRMDAVVTALRAGQLQPMEARNAL
jgi:UDP-N-acetylmuramoyl-tripeptide--D-alanyl-D-alanine ligase